MRKTERLTFGVRLVAASIVGLMTLAAHAQTAGVAVVAPTTTTAAASSGVKSSIQTVDEMIKIENAALLAKSRPAAPAGAAAYARARLVAPTIRVESIYGAAGLLRADLTVNGQPYEGLRKGASVGHCVVREIANRCVALSPASRKTAANLCPESCWTGEQAFVPGIASAGMPMALPGAPGMPMPVPLPAGSFVPVPPAVLDR